MHPFRTLRARALLVVSLALVASMTCQAPASAHATPALSALSRVSLASGTMPSFETEVLRLVNVARSKARKCGSSKFKAAPALRADALLAKVATAHSEDMAAHSYFSHASRDGRSPFTRMKTAGYRYDSAGENIAAGFRTPASVVKAWLKSPGHCKNIMRRSFTEIGVGYATGGVYGTYWTQDFGHPR